MTLFMASISLVCAVLSLRHRAGTRPLEPLSLAATDRRRDRASRSARPAAGHVHLLGLFRSPLIIGRAVGGVETLVIALVVYEAAYLSEIIRAGIESLPKGQVEAATSLGLRYWPTTIPRSCCRRRCTTCCRAWSASSSRPSRSPRSATSSAPTIGFAAAQVNNVLLKTQPFEVYGILALTYFALCFALTSLAHLIGPGRILGRP